MEITLHEDVKELLEELNQIGKSVIFGGYLRDLILNKTPNDLDIATNIPIEVIENKFSHMEKAAKRTTISGHTVFSFKMQKREKIFVEIVSTKSDLSNKPYEADYTINSLLHNGKELIDLTNALQDIKNKIIKEVDINIINNDLSERPYLWLKTLRLVSVTDFDLSEYTFKALNQNKECISDIIPAIFQSEGHKVLNGKNPSQVMRLLSSMGLITDFNLNNLIIKEELAIQPHQKLCYLAVQSNKQSTDDFVSFYKFPETLKEKYNELYQAYYSKEKIPNRLKHQVITLKKLIES